MEEWTDALWNGFCVGARAAEGAGRAIRTWPVVGRRCRPSCAFAEGRSLSLFPTRFACPFIGEKAGDIDVDMPDMAGDFAGDEGNVALFESLDDEAVLFENPCPVAAQSGGEIAHPPQPGHIGLMGFHECRVAGCLHDRPMEFHVGFEEIERIRASGDADHPFMQIAQGSDFRAFRAGAGKLPR